MRRFAEDILDAQDIDYQFVVPEHLREIALGADVRRDVYLIFKECVNNLAKYAEASEAIIELNWKTIICSLKSQTTDAVSTLNP
jgi:signal transduction histidine kinase